MDRIKQQVYDVVSYNKNIRMLQTKIQVLKDRRQLIRNYNCDRNEIQQWVAEADDLSEKAKRILEGSNTMATEKCFYSAWWGPISFSEIGKKLRRISEALREGLALSSKFWGLSYCKNLLSREKLLQEILEASMDNNSMIGIHGMIGVGKTILVEELARRAKNDLLFDTIVMVQVSGSCDVKKTQTGIAEAICLRLSEDDDEETRAQLLYKALEENQQTGSIQQRESLVILDGIQDVIDIAKVGIPYGRDKNSRCKVVITSRNVDVCRKMGVEKSFLVECLNSDEAKILFLERLGDKLRGIDITIGIERYQYVEDVTLKKCKGLPLMINSLARALRSISLSRWTIIAERLEMGTLLDVDEVKEIPSAIFELCNNFIQMSEKRKLFLLCCLIQQGTDISLEKLMRYGIGFGAFEVDSSEVDSAASPVNQMNSWVDELKSLSLLMESDKPRHVKMPGIIRDVAFSAPSQGDYILPVLLEAGISWHSKESYENCVALSMMPHSNFKCLNGLELPKLEAFMSKGDIPSSSPPDIFFQGMQNLKILDISGRPFPLPSSIGGDLKISDISVRPFPVPSFIGDLKNLVTLHLEYCELRGGDTSIICNLPRLEVLSLRGCRFETNLPDEIGNLTNLRVLDLTACRFLITFPIDAVAKLNQLSELYLCHTDRRWSIGDLKEMAALPLEVFEIVIWVTSQLSPGAWIFPNLRRFRILYTHGVPFHVPTDDEEFNSYSRSLWIEGCERVEFEQSGLQDLLQRTECFQIKGVSGLGKGIGELNAINGGGGFSQLKNLFVGHCKGMECMLDASNLSSIIDQQAVEIFPELQVLTLKELSNLTSLLCCPQPCYYSFFPKLRELRLEDLRQLSPYVLPVQLAATLRVMEVRSCTSLLYVFSEIINESGHGADISTVELPYMEKLKLNRLPRLLALEDSSKASIVEDELQILFDDKIKFPSLKEMHLERLDQIRNLWVFLGSNEPYGRGPCFGNLKDFTISDCNELESVFPSQIVDSLSQLEKLQVIRCGSMKEVITSSEVEEDTNPTTIINFPKLQKLKLLLLSSLQCFNRGPLRLKFPMLRELDLGSLMRMKSFTLQNTESLETQGTILFDGEMDFPSLENLQVSQMDIEFFQRPGESTKFPNLSSLTLKALPNLKALPSINSKALRLLNLDDIECCKGLSSTQLPAHPQSMSVIMSCELVKLKLSKFDSLEELIDEEKSVDDHREFDANPLFSLEKLELLYLTELKRIPWCMLTNLRHLNIYGLGWTYLISTSLLVGGHVLLPLLETVDIRSCNRMEAIISREQKEDEDLVKCGVTLFPSLKSIYLGLLYQLQKFSMGRYDAHFPSLEVVEIHECGRLQLFSVGPVTTPRLKHVKVGGRTIEVDTLNDLNIVNAGREAQEAERRANDNRREADEAEKEAEKNRKEAEEVRRREEAERKAVEESKRILEEKRREAEEAERALEEKRKEIKEAERKAEEKRIEVEEAQRRADAITPARVPDLSTQKLTSTEKAQASEASKAKELFTAEKEEWGDWRDTFGDVEKAKPLHK